MDKRGQTTQAVIISVVILLLTAAVLFYFFKMLPYKETVDREACHQSVLLRSQEIVGMEPGQLFKVPLNCKTQEIEIDSTNPDFIKREIANAMYDCWWMLGEGKMNFFSNGWTKDSYCMVCARIKFSEATQKKIKEIKDLDFYLQETQIPKKNMTYAEYFTTEDAPQQMKESSTVLDTGKEYLITYDIIERSAAPERITGTAAAIAVAYLTGGKGMLPAKAASTTEAAYEEGGAYAGGWSTSGISATGIIKGGLIIGSYKAGSLAAGKVDDWIAGTDSDYIIAFGLIPSEAEAIKNFGCESVASIS
jgi:hypothetical protein